MATLTLPAGVHLLRKELGVGAADDREGVIHASPFTGAWSRVAFSRAALWHGRLTFGGESHDGDAACRAWINEAVGNVLAVPLEALEKGIASRAAFPSITGAARQADGTAEYTLAAGANTDWIGSFAIIEGRMVQIMDIPEPVDVLNHAQILYRHCYLFGFGFSSNEDAFHLVRVTPGEELYISNNINRRWRIEFFSAEPATRTTFISEHEGYENTYITAPANAKWLGLCVGYGDTDNFTLTRAPTATIFPAVIPKTLPANISATDHFLFHVIDISGGDRRPWGVADITLEVVEAVAASVPIFLPDDAVFWSLHGVHYGGGVLAWDTDDAGLLEYNQRLIGYDNRLVERDSQA